MKRHHLLALLSLVVPCWLAQAGATTAQVQTTSALAVLPSHFGVGLVAEPDATGMLGWMPQSGVPWDYAYHYLAGGVNTGAGWETWQSNAQFPLIYADIAKLQGYIPTFTYYEMLQSQSSCGNTCATEQQHDLTNLDDPSVMASYFANFRLLMERLGPGFYSGLQGFGGTVIVHVEPDLSGFAEQAALDNSKCYGFCTGQGNNPGFLKAAVASSGDPDAQGLPNTYQGFCWTLLRIRQRYAPNVLLAFHVSDWATNFDVGGTKTYLNAPLLGREAAQFALEAGIGRHPTDARAYDLVFNDVLDRDAAYYQYVSGNPNVWWDRLNATYPNFHEWESYIAAIHAATGLPVIVWQVPEGNQYFDTEDNTDGHYQDNRPEYFFGHVAELAQSGIIAMMFGYGDSHSTHHIDAQADGVTNPASFCTKDGISSGQICNTHVSTSSDDDGGFIRMSAQQYYANGPLPLPSLSPPTPTATPTSVGGRKSRVTPTPAVAGTPTPTPTTVNGRGGRP